ncbi:MAG: M42 family metallopeptidase [Thermoflavifilum sp.]|nr:M42 family metallopeptidase [Thermoflavifilum sp.]MCL6513962.1 M42 family metallopeptidase [Alicyclobacillus sp.]
MLLKELTEAVGPSGFEDEIRDVIRTHATRYADHIFTDSLGSLYCEVHGANTGPRVMLDAHMDEVGLMIVRVDGDGLLRFRAIGGIDPRVLLSKPVRVGPHRVWGVIGWKPVHFTPRAERSKVPGIEDLYIDIGARDDREARQVVQPGDVAVFATAFEPFGDGCAKAKSFDDRVGCAVLLEVLKARPLLPITAVFTVQEEIGLRGAEVAAKRVKPDIAIALEGTVCYDVAGTPSYGEGTKLGGGPAFTVYDSRTVADRRFLDFMIRVAEKHHIPYQLRRVKGGSNDFGAIQVSGRGVMGGSISVPVRYIHAPVQIISMDDYHATVRMVLALLQEIAEGGFTPPAGSGGMKA